VQVAEQAARGVEARGDRTGAQADFAGFGFDDRCSCVWLDLRCGDALAESGSRPGPGPEFLLGGIGGHDGEGIGVAPVGRQRKNQFAARVRSHVGRRRVALGEYCRRRVFVGRPRERSRRHLKPPRFREAKS